ncbi:MAG: hypothetical protein ACYYKD_09305 [Rhodospirillales bacterium]
MKSSALAEEIEGPFVTAELIESPADAPGAAAQEDILKLIAAAPGSEGFLGLESTRDACGLSVTRTYWTSADKLRLWAELTGAEPVTWEHSGGKGAGVGLDEALDALKSLSGMWKKG